ncbi:MAG: TonB-dependent receptor [Flavobacteriales bacterium CG_4_8_14_3_um_filter_35_10]|nr:TonB-dependent receptor [Zetaproteobacteria bacterium]NDK17488.1 TonB-dependent receptor [Flavobacteriales bacterium]PIX07756.1 MAG: TonB-dependent receptor [Flavobacteriales bacterium CG_4_8_14_3_um_filter_35_10]
MKLTTFLLIVSMFKIEASNYAQNTKITLELNNVTIEKVLNEIELKTDFKFFFNRSDIDVSKLVSVKAKRDKVKNILNQMFLDMSVSFELLDKQIIIKNIPENNEENQINLLIDQQKEIKGVVTDHNGAILPGVEVIVVGTNRGTQTDFDGKYSIKAEEGDFLEFSFIGMKTEKIVVGTSTTINVQLKEDAASLDEVVLIGYGQISKKDLTGAVASVSEKDFKSATTSDPTLALQGRVAGVYVQSNGGSPGASVNVLIRGAASITNVDPLYVVDGVFLQSLSSINPYDVKSIEVLKDASAAAIYGSRAANGVIIVTTNRGRQGGLIVNAHSSLGITTVTNKLNLLNARQYADVSNIAFSTPAPANSTAFDPNIDTDWQNLSLRTGVVEDYGFDISGGGENSSIFFSANYFKEKGVVISSGFDRINIRVNSEFWTTNKKFKLTQSLALAQKNLNENNFYGNDGFDFPTIPLRDDFGSFVAPNAIDHGVSVGLNRYASALTFDDKNQINEVFGNISGELEILPNLKYKLNLGLNFQSNYNSIFVPTYFWSVSNAQFNQNAEADLTEDRSTRIDLLMDNTITYTTDIDKHHINAVIGNTREKITSRGTSVFVSDFPSNDIRVVSGASSFNSATGEEIISGLQSWFGRVIYDYDKTYFLTATVRQDESSRFNKDFRTGTFPSVSAGWKISNEDFFAENNVFSDLKLRASYGELGSQNVPDFAFSPVININSPYTLGSNQTSSTGFSITQFTVPNLRWETSKTTNFGVDAGFFNGKLNASLDYYVRKTEDILISLPIPPSSGSNLPITVNSASVENKGFELNIGYRNNDNEDFTYSANFNINTTQNKVTSLGQLGNPIIGGIFSADLLTSTRANKGDQLGVFWGYETAGLYGSQAEIDNDPNLRNDTAARSILKPGELIWVDQNGDGIVNDDDKVKIGDPFPDFDFGLNLSASYKNFDFSLFFQGQVGNEIFNARKYYLNFEERSNFSTDRLNAWSSTNSNSNIPVIGATRVDASDYYVENGSYLRLKQLRIAYNVKDMIKGLSNTRFFIGGQNLLTFTGYSGYDPELGVSTSTGGARLLSRGVDNTSYPQSIQVTAGIQLTIN